VIAIAPSVAALLGLLGACGSNKPSSAVPPPDAGPTGPAFEPVAPAVYVGKVKNLLVGLPPTDAEVTAVTADPTALGGLISGWMQLPQYTQKMQRFFELAFQQTQVTANDFSDQAYPKRLIINSATTPLLLQNLEQSFARTMLALIADEEPLTVGMTTHKLMMTTALKETYAFLDQWQVDDAGKVTDRFKQANSGLKITVGTAQGPIPIADTLDPTSANYMHWYDPDAATEDSSIAGCASDPIVYPASAITLHWLLYGSLDGRKAADGTSCPQSGGTATAPQVTAADFSDWTMVTIREPKSGEATTPFYDLPSLRTATELVLSIPRVGFFSTPAFFANWQTNTSNQMRVTMNQTLIVALGAQVDRVDTTAAPQNPPPGLDAVHASDPACLGCHQTLDPLRSIFSATYSWNYHNQVDSTLAAQKGMFLFRGVAQPLSTMDDLGTTLAQHPLLPEAWAQKLCAYATSAACASDDPEFQRVVGVFKSSGLSWNALVSELFASPLVTNAAATATATAGGEVVAVARRDHLCAALDARLGFADVCGLEAVTNKQKNATIAQIASGLPSDGYGRGAVMPVLPNAPTLFYRAGAENICAGIAAQVIDGSASSQAAGVKSWSSTAPDAAIADFVGIVMGLVPSDPRSAPATTLLKGHFTAAMQQGASAADALKSTFVTACLAPSAVSIGM
jgi:hypothetical protein